MGVVAEKYEACFQCELCGATFPSENVTFDSRSDALMYLTDRDKSDVSVHHCNGGGMGTVKFIGCRPIAATVNHLETFNNFDLIEGHELRDVSVYNFDVKVRFHDGHEDKVPYSAIASSLGAAEDKVHEVFQQNKSGWKVKEVLGIYTRPSIWAVL